MYEENKEGRLGDPLEFMVSRDHGPKSRVENSAEDHQPGERQNNTGQDQGQQADDQKETPLRKNETGLGQPDLSPGPEEKQDIHSVSLEEMDISRKDQEELSREFEQKLMEFEKTGIKIPAALYRVFLWIVLFLGSVLGLFLTGQGVRFAGEVSNLDSPWNVLVSAIFWGLLALVVLVLCRLSAMFFKFRKKARIDVKALKKLSERRRFQELAAGKMEQAREVLYDYVDEYSLSTPGLKFPGLDMAELEKLKKYKQALLDKYGYADCSRWIREFEESFVYLLDKAAARRIRAYARNVAMGTAASPFRFLDQLVVLYSSLKLISELLQIYHLRPALGQSTIILARAIIQAYLSGIAADQSEAGVEAFSEHFKDLFNEISSTTGMSMVTDATRLVLPHVSQGAMNAFLIWRLGKQARKMVRPL
ncbi:MAG: DUF697 domain-containing protein [Desulfonatronovibrionaceae bacterium]